MNRLVSALLLAFSLMTAMAAYGQEYRAAESFTLETADGELLNLPADQNGTGIYLFWASWCPYCRALMPHLQSLKDEFGDQITIYALNFRDQKDPAVYLGEQGFSFVLLPQADEIAESWSVHGTPGLFIVDQEGRIRFNLYEVLTTNPAGYEEMNHTQRAQRRAPFWAARIRESLDGVIGASN